MHAIAAQFVHAITTHDEVALRECFAPDATFRALIPPGLRERDGAEAAAALITAWFSESSLRLLAEDSDEVGGLLRIDYSFEGSEDGEPFVVEQHVFCTVVDGRIAAADLLCSGFRPPS